MPAPRTTLDIGNLPPNPFPQTAVAQIGSSAERADATVRTAAVVEATGHLEAYLRRRGQGFLEPDESRQLGGVMAVHGGYGSGKTHLAGWLLHRARQAGHRTVYVDAADTVLSLHQRLLNAYEMSEVQAEIRLWLAQVVSDTLAQDRLTQEPARLLRSGAIDVDTLVADLGLPFSTYLHDLEDRLADALRDPWFARALALMPRPGFAPVVWKWLLGNPPLASLQDRGLEWTIDSDSTALAAMTALADVLAGGSRGFVLVIDEMQRLLGDPSRLSAADQAAFREFLGVFLRKGGFLVLVGLPEFYRAMPHDLRRNVGLDVSMPPMTADEAQTYIRRRQYLTSRRQVLEPFTPEAVETMVQVSSGIPRDIVRVCHHAFHRAALDGLTLIDPALILQVAADHLGTTSVVEVLSRIGTILRQVGLDFSRDHTVSPSPAGRVDFWVRIQDDPRVDRAVVVADTPLVQEDEPPDALERRARAITGERPGTQILLVVTRPLTPERRTRYTNAFGLPPIEYDSYGGEDTLYDVLSGWTRTPNPTGETDLGPLRQRIDTINRQQASTFGFMEQIAGQIDKLRAASERNYELIRRDVQDLRDGQDTPEPAQQLPPAVQDLFDDALGRLRQAGRVDDLLADVFRPGPADSTTALPLRAILRSPAATSALGVTTLLEQLVRAFRDGIAQWADGTSSPAPRSETLRRLCRTYDATYEFLLLSELPGLSEITARRREVDDTGPSLGRIDSPADQLRKVLDGLGSRVQSRLATGENTDS